MSGIQKRLVYPFHPPCLRSNTELRRVSGAIKPDQGTPPTAHFSSFDTCTSHSQPGQVFPKEASYRLQA